MTFSETVLNIYDFWFLVGIVLPTFAICFKSPVQSIPTHSNPHQPTSNYSNQLQTTSTRSNPLQPTPTHSNPLQLTPHQYNPSLQLTSTCSNPLQTTSTRSTIHKPNPPQHKQIRFNLLQPIPVHPNLCFKASTLTWTQTGTCITTTRLLSQADTNVNSCPDATRAQECLDARSSHASSRCCRINYDWTPARCHWGLALLTNSAPTDSNQWGANLENAIHSHSFPFRFGFVALSGSIDLITYRVVDSYFFDCRYSV